VVRGAVVNMNGVYGSRNFANQVASALGNSGGPIIRRARPGQVQAMGTVSAGTRALLFACRLYQATVCGPDVIWGNISLILRAYGARLA
jgi:aspartate/tyrosine/aromatic aminotransferase